MISSCSPQLPATHLVLDFFFPAKGSWTIRDLSILKHIFFRGEVSSLRKDFPKYSDFIHFYQIFGPPPKKRDKTTPTPHQNHCLRPKKHNSPFFDLEARTFGMNSFFHEFKIHAPFGSPCCILMIPFLVKRFLWVFFFPAGLGAINESI